MAASSSSSGGGQVFQVNLYSADGKTLLAKVDVPVPMPMVLQYQGNTYVYSNFVHTGYVQTVPFVPPTDLGAPSLSVLAFPAY